MAEFTPDPRMRFCKPFEAYWGEIAERGLSWSIHRDDGAVVGAAGLYRYDKADPGLAEMWALFSADAGPLMLAVTRRTLAVLERERGQFDQIQAHVEASFPQAHKWVLLLGFEAASEPPVQLEAGMFQRYVWKG